MSLISIVGIGALGSHVAQAVRGLGDLRLIDFDRVEQKNTLSQFHSRPAIGKNKAQSLAQYMQMLWGVRPSPIPHKLGRTNADTLLKGSDLVIDCVDNSEARREISLVVEALGIPCLHGALAADGQLGRSVWHSKFHIDDDLPGVPTCEDGRHLPFIILVSAAIARSAQAYLDTGAQYSYHVTQISGVSRV